MAKGSGTTRGSASGNPRGFNSANPIPFTEYVRLANTTPFKRVDRGEYELKMPNGDSGNIYSEERYGNEDWKASVHLVSGDNINLGWYNSQEAAENAVREELKKYR